MEQHREPESGQRCRRLRASPSDLHPSRDPLLQPILHRRVTHRQVASRTGGDALRDSGQEIVDAIGPGHARRGNVDPPPRKEPTGKRLIERDHVIEIGGEATRDEDIFLPGRLGARFRLLRQCSVAPAPRLPGHGLTLIP